MSIQKDLFSNKKLHAAGYWSLTWLKGRSETHSAFDKRYIKRAQNSNLVTKWEKVTKWREKEHCKVQNIISPPRGKSLAETI